MLLSAVYNVVFSVSVTQANAFRNEHHIYVKGADIPEPIATFQQLQDL